MLAWRFNAKRRQIVEINLKSCFPELSQQDLNSMARCHFDEVGKSLIDLSRVWFASDESLLSDIDVEGWEHVEQAQAAGKSLILHVAHSTGLEYGAVMVASKIPGIGFYKPARNKLVDWFVLRSRQRFSNSMFTRDDGVRSYVKKLKGGAILYYLSDEDLGRENSEFVSFFAATKATLPAAGRMAKLVDAAVLPAITVLDVATGRYRLIVDPALEGFPTGSAAEDASRLNKALEKLIMRAPEQYMWFLKLLKTRQDGRNIYREDI